MSSFALILRKRTFPAITMLILLVLAGGYYLFYKSHREDYFRHRYLRQLAFESTRIGESVGAYRRLLESFRNDREGGYRPDDLPQLAKGIERVDLPEEFPSSSDGVSLQERIVEGRLWIYAGPFGDYAYRLQPFDLFQPGATAEFDVFFIARRDGTILFQRGSNGLRLASLGKLIGSDGKERDLAPLATSSSQAAVRLAGEEYELFLQPCCQAIREASSDTEEASWSPDWVVGGLVSASKFSVESLRISFTVAIFLVSLFVLVILSAPFLRLLYVGAEDKVRVWDALSVGATAVVGIGLLTLLLLDLHAYRSLAGEADRRLLDFANQIVRNVEGELADAARQLQTLNRLVAGAADERLGGLPAEGCEDLFADEGSEGIFRPRVDRLEAKLPSSWITHPGFERFAWIDAKGQQCFKWTIGKGREPRVSVGERRYFQDAHEGRLWSMAKVPGPDEKPFRFALEPVVSWSSGQRTVMLATPVYGHLPAERRFVGMLSIELSSVNRPVLPAGYGFAVIDARGNVLFHSDPARSGQENFFEEIDQDRRVRAAVFARRSGYESPTYMGRGHQLYLRPVGELLPDWTLVVFSDKREIRGFNVDLMTTAMLLLILYLLVFMVACWLARLFCRSYRGAWLWPDLAQGEAYTRLVWLHLFGVAAFLGGILVLDGVSLLWFAFAFPWAVLLLSYRVRTAAWTPPVRFLQVAAGLALVLLLVLLAPGSGVGLWPFDPEAARARSLFLALVALGLALTLVTPSLLDRWRISLPLLRKLRQRPAGRSAFAFVRRLGKRLSPVRERRGKGHRRRAQRAYLLAAALLLTVVAVMPAASFFAVAHRAHLETRIRHKQLQLAVGIEEREARLRKTFFPLGEAGAGLLRQRLSWGWDVYRCGIDFDDERPGFAAAGAPPHIVTAGMGGSTGRTAVAQEGRGPLLLPAFLLRVLPLYTDDFIKVRRLLENEDAGGDRAFVWRWPSAGRVQLVLGQRLQGASTHLSTSVPRVSPSGFLLLLPVSLFLLAGTVLSLCWLISRKVFLLDLPPAESDQAAGAVGAFENGILVGPWTEEQARRLAERRQMELIDLAQLPSRDQLFASLQKPDLPRSVCLFHFEHRLHDEAHNLWKLELLEELIYGRSKTVLILSHVVPVWYLLDRKPPPPPPAPDAAADPEKAAKAEAMREERQEKAREEIRARWRKLLRKMTFSMTDLKSDPGRLTAELERLRKEKRSREFLQRVQRECGSAQLQEIAADMLRGRGAGWEPDWEWFVDELRQRAESHYQTLWTLCSEREKIVLVHLAEGGLVNARNERAVRKLLARGLLVRSPDFRLMNESFRRYVVAGICRDEVRVLEQVAEASTWSKIRAPLVAVLIGAACFLFITQREVFDTSVTFVGAVAAALPALFRVLGAAGGPAPPQAKA